MAKAFKAQIFSIFLVVMVVFSACSKAEKLNVYNFNMTEKINTLDPQYATTSTEKTIILNTFTNLTRYTANGNLELYGADSYGVSEDKKTHTFYVKKGIKWYSGQELTAEDYVYAITRLKDSPYADVVNNLGLSATATDKYTLQVKVSEPVADIRYIFAESYMAPCNADFLISTKGKYGISLETIASSGKYRVNSFSADSVKLVGNTEELKDTLIKINITDVSDTKAQIEAFEDGNLDALVLNASESNAVSEIMKNSEDVAVNLRKNSVAVLAFNTKSPIFKNLELRKAFMPSADIFKKSTNRLLPPAVGPSEQVFKTLETDISEYREILKKLGMETLPNIKFIASEMYRDVATNYAKAKNSVLGTLMSPQILNEKDLQEALQQGNFDIAIYNLNGSKNDVAGFLSYFSSGNSKNYSKIADDDYNSVIIKNDFKLAQSILAEKYYLYPIDYPSEYLVIRKKLGNFFERSGIYYFDF